MQVYSFIKWKNSMFFCPGGAMGWLSGKCGWIISGHALICPMGRRPGLHGNGATDGALSADRQPRGMEPSCRVSEALPWCFCPRCFPLPCHLSDYFFPTLAFPGHLLGAINAMDRRACRCQVRTKEEGSVQPDPHATGSFMGDRLVALPLLSSLCPG